MDERETGKYDFSLYGSGKERISYEQLIYLQMLSINEILSRRQQFDDLVKAKEFNLAVENLDILIEAEKDKQHKEDFTKVEEEYNKKIKEIEERKITDIKSNKGRRVRELDNRILLTRAEFSKKQYRQIIKTLSRRGRLFKNIIKGVV